MKSALMILIAGSILLLGARLPAATSSDRDLIIRLQGEVLVLQRQLRDLQEAIDRNHETTLPKLTAVSEQTETASKSLASINDHLNQTGALQQNNLQGVIRRLAHIEEQLGGSQTAIKNLAEGMKEIQTLLAKPATPRP